MWVFPKRRFDVVLHTFNPRTGKIFHMHLTVFQRMWEIISSLCLLWSVIFPNIDTLVFAPAWDLCISVGSQLQQTFAHVNNLERAYFLSFYIYIYIYILRTSAGFELDVCHESLLTSYIYTYIYTCTHRNIYVYINVCIRVFYMYVYI